MISLLQPVKCRCCRRRVPILYYDSTPSGFFCHACHQEMMALRLREVSHLKRLGSKRWVCGQCGNRVLVLYFELRVNRFICSDCKAYKKDRVFTPSIVLILKQ
jgi:hypothetical protein